MLQCKSPLFPRKRVGYRFVVREQGRSSRDPTAAACLLDCFGIAA